MSTGCKNTLTLKNKMLKNKIQRYESFKNFRLSSISHIYTFFYCIFVVTDSCLEYKTGNQSRLNHTLQII